MILVLSLKAQSTIIFGACKTRKEGATEKKRSEGHHPPPTPHEMNVNNGDRLPIRKII